MYQRIFPDRKFRVAVMIVMGITIAYTIAAVLLTIFACNPISKAWVKTLPGTCVDSRTIWYCEYRKRHSRQQLGTLSPPRAVADQLLIATSVLNIVTDLMIIALPINQIRNLQLPLVKKILLLCLFSLGTFVIACTIIRMITVSPQTTATDQTCKSPKTIRLSLIPRYAC